MAKPDILERSARSLYERWLSEQGYQKRTNQEEMIRFICAILGRSTDRFGIIEAGTGTGKSIAYCVPSALEARLKKKKVIIVTSTVVLQEQLLNTELRQLQSLSTEGFSFGLIKGRRRYVCVDRLHKAAQDTGDRYQELFEGDVPSQGDRAVATQVLRSFESKNWDGNMDRSPTSVPSRLARRITTDSRGCSRNQCKYSGECPYYKTRDKINQLDVIVTNYALLLSAMAEDVDILPDPSDCIYIFDEVHRLNEIVSSNGSTQVNLANLKEHLKKTLSIVNRLTTTFAVPASISNEQQRLIDLSPQLEKAIDLLATHLGTDGKAEENGIDHSAYGVINEFRFKNGLVPVQTSQHLTEPLSLLNLLNASLDNLVSTMKEIQDPSISEAISNRFIDEVSTFGEEVQNAVGTFNDWINSENSVKARWFQPSDSSWVLQSTPIDVANYLQEAIWSKAHAVICTSATVTTNTGFKDVAQKIGLKLDGSNSVQFDSPFDYRSCVTFQWAAMDGLEPRDRRYIEKTIAVLPSLLQSEPSALVLFTNISDMTTVFDGLPKAIRDRCLLQRSMPIEALVQKHRETIDEGKPSYIIATDSFREGVDLPDEYCRHVILAKMPFPVPSDPVLSTYREANNLNWMETDLQIGILKFKQACGRLIRNENDFGRITMLDRRPLEKRYGEQVLNALPRYTFVDLAR